MIKNKTRVDPIGDQHRLVNIFGNNHIVTISQESIKILFWERNRKNFELFLKQKGISFEKREVPSRKQRQFEISFKNNNLSSFKEVELFFQN